jgi:predicted ATPase
MPIPFELITKEQSADFVKKQYSGIGIRHPKSLSEFYDMRITPKKLYFIEEPETSMSLQESKELASLLYDCAKCSENQFVITTNSPVLLGIKNAVIYDFDQSVIMDETWYYSSLATRHVKFYRELERDHRKCKLKKEKIK